MIEFEMIASRACVHCGQTIEVTLKEVQNHSINTTPWIMFHTYLFELPILECCNTSELPTHIHMKNDEQANDILFSGKFKVGSEDVPVIIDDPSSYAFTRTYKEQVELEQQFRKQNKLWKRQQDDFFQKTYTYFSLHFEQIIDEMDHQEVLDILRTFEDTCMQGDPTKPRRFVYKGKNERKLITKWIKKEIKSLAQEESEEIKKYLFFLIVDYFIQLKLIPQIHYLKWDPQKFEKMIGESLLTYLLVSFPLTSYFSFLKDEALLRLANKGQLQKELRQLLEKTQKELATVSSNNVKMQQMIESQRKAMADLEMKNEKLRIQNSHLEELLEETGDEKIIARQSRKIKEFKGIIDAMQEEIKQLRAKEVSETKENENSEVIDENSKKIDLHEPTDFSALSGKTVAIYGDIQGYETDEETFGCKILSCESLKNPNAVGILRSSDILVVLTQHISHSCMWSIKEYANQEQLPVVYSRHTNLEIILEQVLAVLE